MLIIWWNYSDLGRPSRRPGKSAKTFYMEKNLTQFFIFYSTTQIFYFTILILWKVPGRLDAEEKNRKYKPIINSLQASRQNKSAWTQPGRSLDAAVKRPTRRGEPIGIY
ncbi:hypothetical protein HAP94_18510 [Acidithiobacillus ferrivorans]|nr:hypothetical protein [Acidithiobacillus ferrivorans]